MDFALTEEQTMFRDMVRRFAQTELAPHAARRAREQGYPWDVAERMAELGLMGIALPEADGGLGGTLVDAIVAIQEVDEACPRSGDVIQAGNFGPVRSFAEYAAPDQKARYLGSILAGRAVISLGMTEPEAGSAVTELANTATPDGDGFVINGTKTFGSHSSEAAVFLVYVRFGPGLDGIGSVLIEKGTPGLTVGQPTAFRKGEDRAQLYFDNLRIPAENVVLGAGGFQGLQWKFADMSLRLESAQLLLMRAAVNAGSGLPSAQETAMAKLACNEAGFHAANEALQIMGALGFSEDSNAQYCLRRTRGWMIAGGSVEILKNRIAEGIFGRSFSRRAEA